MWLDRIDEGANLTSNLSVLSAGLTNLIQGPNSSEIAMVTGPISGKIGMLMGMQSIDYRSMMISNLPAEDSTEPWNSDGPVLTTFVVVTEPEEHGVEVIGDVQEKVSEWAEELASQAKSETGDSEISVFSFSQLATGQNANLGKELGYSKLIVSAASWIHIVDKVPKQARYCECIGVDCICNLSNLRNGWFANTARCQNGIQRGDEFYPNSIVGNWC